MPNNTLSVERDSFPFPVQLHLKLYIDYWRSDINSKNTNVSGDTIKRIEQTLQENPFLSEPLDDIGLLKNHQEFLNIFFAALLPHQSLSNAIQAICLPFSYHFAITATEAYNKLVYAKEGQFNVLDISLTKEHIDYRVLYAYKYILKKFYNLDIKVDQPIISSYVNRETSLSRYFKLSGSSQFVDVINLAPLPYIDEQILQKMLDQHFKTSVWAKLLPPDNFLFRGFSLISLVDITIEEAINRVQYTLLNRLDTNEANWFTILQQEIRNLFRLSGLKLGIATVQSNGELNYNSKNPLWNSLLLSELNDDYHSWLQGSYYEEILKTGQTIIIEDLKKHTTDMNRSMQLMLDAGYRNLLLTPLLYNEQMIGILELASHIPGEINGLSLFKINQIKHIFANALKRHIEEFENKVEAIMLEKFTTIHPAIQWRFRDAAIELLDRRTINTVEQDIFFENVYPFYGSLDIRDSSKKRNKAIEQDLLFNLENALIILRQGYETLSFDILGELMNDVEKRLKRIQTSFTTGDEVSLAEFIRKDINPVITHLHQHYPELFASTQFYNEKVCSESGICTSNRLAYEEALSLVNRCIVNSLDEEEADLQRLYPCYFEKYRTDGVEYNIYIGSSITPGRLFDPLYLENLRLRQLLWTCKIMRMVDELQPRLQALFENALPSMPFAGYECKMIKTTIEIAPLILAYGNPITLKFRFDEKRLDVDGSYNIRYEMLKKRIDKAIISGTKERLTLPGHIAIVYARDEDASIYKRHLEYLANKGYLQTEYEYFDLETLQGVEGLRAIRAKLKDNSLMNRKDTILVEENKDVIPRI